MNDPANAPVPRDVRERVDGEMSVELSGDGMLRREESVTQAVGSARQDRTFLLAERDPDGHYQIRLTEDGMEAFETALGLANDFGRHRTVSTESTIADLMDRAAIREELSEVSRRAPRDPIGRLRREVLRVRYRGSDEPAAPARALSHILRAAAVLVITLWTLRQFGIVIADIQAIPGILAQLPSDVLHLDPGRAGTDIGRKIADAQHHLVAGMVGVVGIYVAGLIFRPFEHIYRKDALAPGLRSSLRCVSWALHAADPGTDHS